MQRNSNEFTQNWREQIKLLTQLTKPAAGEEDSKIAKEALRLMMRSMGNIVTRAGQ